MEKKYELEQGIILIGGKEALEFAKKHGISYESLIEYLLAGYTIEQARVLIKFSARVIEAVQVLRCNIKNSLEEFSKLALTYAKKKPFRSKYLKRCDNRQKLYNKRKKLGRVK